MLPKDDSSDSQDSKIFIDFDDKDQLREDPRNFNKIKSENSLRYTEDTLKTQESMAEECGIGLSKKQRKKYIEQHKNAYYYKQDPWKYGYTEDEENTPSVNNYELKPMSLAQASPMQTHYNSTYTGMNLPVFNNDNDFDTMFAQAELKSRKRNSEISISMTHAGDDSSQVQRKKHKSRIGERKKSDSDDGEILNSQQSKSYTEYMENKYSSGMALTSNFGQEYMKKQSVQAHERKNQKLKSLNQVKKDQLEDPSFQQIQKQLLKRKQKNSTIDQEPSQDTYLGQMTRSYFTEEGRKQQEQDSQRLKEQNFKKVMELNSDRNRIIVHENPSQKLQSEQNELEYLKKGLQESSTTVHPNKFVQQRDTSDVSQNVISMVQKQQVAQKKKEQQYDQRGVTGSSLGYGQTFQYTDQMLQQQTSAQNNATAYYNSTKNKNQNIFNINGNTFQSAYNQSQMGLPTYNYGQMQHYSAQPRQESPVAEVPNKIFYESPSKYISLKKFTELQYQFQDQTNSIYSKKKRDMVAEYSLESWFKGLLNHEKAITLTIIDAELVSLIKSMHYYYAEYGHGFYQSKFPQNMAQSPQDADKYQKVKEYNLLFKKPTFKLEDRYDHYGPLPTNLSKDKQKFQESLITNIRVIQIGDQEAITLSNYFLENTDFLMRIFQGVDKNFMATELKIEKTDHKSAMEGSVFQSSKGDEQKTEGRKQGRADMFFTLNERDFKPQSFKDRHSVYGKGGAQKTLISKEVIQDKSTVSLGQLLCHLFEKSINIQYHEFQNKMSNQMKDFFFTPNENNLFNQDMKLAKYWKDLNQDEQSTFWQTITKAQEGVIDDIKQSDMFKKRKQCDDIQEETETSNSSFSNGNGSLAFNKRINSQSSYMKPMYSNINGDSDSRSDNWDNQVQAKLDKNEDKIGKLKAKKLNKDYLNTSESDFSDDIENQKRSSIRGYKPLGSIKRESKSIMSLGKPAGRGYKALDYDSDRTITENSENSSETNNVFMRDPTASGHYSQRKGAIRTNDGHYSRKQVYSTEMDKQVPSEGEIINEKSDQTSYSGDKFESEDDQDDDFNLPKHHEQNFEYNETPIGQNIKKQLESKKELPKIYQSTGSQAVISKKEEKKIFGSKAQKIKTQQQVQMSKDQQQESIIRIEIKKQLKKLQADGKILQSENEGYLFIRQFSTYKCLCQVKDLKEFTNFKILELIHKSLDEEHQAYLMRDLDDEPKKKKKKGSKKEEEPFEEEEKSAKRTRQRKNRKKKKSTQPVDPPQEVEDEMQETKIELENLIQQDKTLTEGETMLKTVMKSIFKIDEQSSDRSDKKDASWEKNREKYVGERTSLLSGQFQQQKYPDEQEGLKISIYEIEKIEKKYNEYQSINPYDSLHDEAQKNLEEDFDEEFRKDPTYAYFNETGLRKRSQEEIDLARSQAEKKVRRSETDQMVEKMKSEQIDTLQGLNELNLQVKEMKFTDLKQEREKNNQMADHHENAEEEEGAKKKNKKKKRKSKKKKHDDEQANVPDESEMLCKEIEQVQQDESDDNKFFDDNFQEKDELYNQASEVLELQDIKIEMCDNAKKIIEKLDRPDVAKQQAILKEKEEETKKEEIKAPHAPEQPQISHKKQAKLDKKKEAKQNAKLKAQQLKQQEAEQKAIKAQQRKELLQQKQAPQPTEEILSSLGQKEMMQLPSLGALNIDTGRGDSAVSKRVKFQRDESYDATKVPQRGSSRGTSQASSNKNKQDEILDEFDGLFPKDYVKPQQSTTQSIIDSLENSKKNSLESSTNKSTKDEKNDAARQARILQKKLEDLHDSKRSSSIQHKRSRSQSPCFEPAKKKKSKKSEKSVDPSKIQEVEEPPKFEIIRPELPKAVPQKKKKSGKTKKAAPQPEQKKKKEPDVNYIQAFDAATKISPPKPEAEEDKEEPPVSSPSEFIEQQPITQSATPQVLPQALPPQQQTQMTIDIIRFTVQQNGVSEQAPSQTVTPPVMPEQPPVFQQPNWPQNFIPTQQQQQQALQYMQNMQQMQQMQQNMGFQNFQQMGMNPMQFQNNFQNQQQRFGQQPGQNQQMINMQNMMGQQFMNFQNIQQQNGQYSNTPNQPSGFMGYSPQQLMQYQQQYQQQQRQAFNSSPQQQQMMMQHYFQQQNYNNQYPQFINQQQQLDFNNNYNMQLQQNYQQQQQFQQRTQIQEPHQINSSSNQIVQSKVVVISDQVSPVDPVSYNPVTGQPYGGSTPPHAQFPYQNQITPQVNKVQQLQSQGYVLHMNDFQQLSSMSLQELNYVNEFYEVLDAQILKLKQDQENKLSKIKRLRDVAFDLIKGKIKRLYKSKKKDSGQYQDNVKVEIYGSMATGLAIDSSDLDILISDFIDQTSPRFNGLSRLELIEEMAMIHEELNDIYALKQNTLIDSASVPVIKLQIDLIQICQKDIKDQTQSQNLKKMIQEDEELQILNIDITLNEPKKVIEEIEGKGQSNIEHLGLQCCKYIKGRLDQHHDLKTLALVFKKFLSLKNMNKPFSGGLSSYSLIQMILAILKIGETVYAQNQLSLGMIFKHFIWEYGFNFQPFEKGIDQDGNFKPKSEFQYIYHNLTCNINQRMMNENTDSQNPFIFDKNTCTCGYSKNTTKATAANGPPGSDQNQLVNLLQKLLHNQQEEETPMARPKNPVGPSPNQTQLIIVDPLNKFNNIGKSSYNFSMIQQELRDVYQRLNEELVKFVKYASNRAESEPFNIDGLIPRILQVKYQIMQKQEEEKVSKQEEVKSPVKSSKKNKKAKKQ